MPLKLSSKYFLKMRYMYIYNMFPCKRHNEDKHDKERYSFESVSRNVLDQNRKNIPGPSGTKQIKVCAMGSIVT